jgi:hypothetical protein
LQVGRENTRHITLRNPLKAWLGSQCAGISEGLEIPAHAAKYSAKKLRAFGKIRQAKMGASRETIPMTTTIGIFDSAVDLDKAVERLARAGFDDFVSNEALVGEEAINVATRVFAPGTAPAVAWGSAESNLPTKPDRDKIVRAFKTHLAHCHLPNEVIEAYANTFYHGGEFVLVRTDTEHAGHVMLILRECGATQVNRHDSLPLQPEQNVT